MQLPSLDSLRCFDAAARSASFRAAARSVSLSPAAVSQRIRQLEEQLGAQLFERTPHAVRLTTAGRVLWPRARAVLEAAERCAAPLQPPLEAEPMELTLGG